MLTYRATAMALKAFSINSVTRTAYRRIGNVIGGKSRANAVAPHYLTRADQKLALHRATRRHPRRDDGA